MEHPEAISNRTDCAFCGRPLDPIAAREPMGARICAQCMGSGEAS